MACPHKDEDEKILAAIAARKAAESPVLQTMTHIWMGRLADFLMMNGDDNIILIEKQAEGWMILTRY